MNRLAKANENKSKEEPGPRWRSRLIGLRRCYLEDDFRRQLHLAGAVVASRAAVVDRGSDHAKVGAILALTRDTPYWMVEGIEGVHPQLQL